MSMKIGSASPVSAVQSPSDSAPAFAQAKQKALQQIAISTLENGSNMMQSAMQQMAQSQQPDPDDPDDDDDDDGDS